MKLEGTKCVCVSLSLSLGFSIEPERRQSGMELQSQIRMWVTDVLAIGSLSEGSRDSADCKVGWVSQLAATLSGGFRISEFDFKPRRDSTASLLLPMTSTQAPSIRLPTLSSTLVGTILILPYTYVAYSIHIDIYLLYIIYPYRSLHPILYPTLLPVPSHFWLLLAVCPFFPIFSFFIYFLFLPFASLVPSQGSASIAAAKVAVFPATSPSHSLLADVPSGPDVRTYESQTRPTGPRRTKSPIPSLFLALPAFFIAPLRTYIFQQLQWNTPSQLSWIPEPSLHNSTHPMQIPTQKLPSILYHQFFISPYRETAPEHELLKLSFFQTQTLVAKSRDRLSVWIITIEIYKKKKKNAS